MDGTRALVVADPSEGTRQLIEALRSEGYVVDEISPGELATSLSTLQAPDLMLICASIGAQGVAAACLELAVDGTPAAAVVFAVEEDFNRLEECAAAGYDYLVPPFLPGLVRARLTSATERGQLALSSTASAAADLLRDDEEQIGIARQIQSGFLPERLPVLSGWQLAAGFRPAKAVSGDFYDAFELTNCGRFGLVVADVCDKGVPAALFMALIRTLLRHTAEHTDEMRIQPQDDLTPTVDGTVNSALRDGVVVRALSVSAGPLIQAVAGTNRYLARNHLRQGYFATMFFGLLDPETGSFLYINGGHNPPVLTRASGERSLLRPTGPAVGMRENSEFTLGHEVLDPGDCLFIYSDGVTEARDADGEFFGMDRLTALLGPEADDSAEVLLGRVDTELRLHAGQAPQHDDITMLVVRNTGAPSVV